MSVLGWLSGTLWRLAMTPNDFVYLQIFKGALKSGSSERIAKEEAVLGLEEYKKSKIGKSVSVLIDFRIKNAKRRSKK